MFLDEKDVVFRKDRALVGLRLFDNLLDEGRGQTRYLFTTDTLIVNRFSQWSACLGRLFSWDDRGYQAK